MIELAILGLLSDQELHGYELKKQLADLLGPWSSVSFGSLYPALARLEKAGRVKAVEAHTLVTPAGPMTGALSGELAAFRAKISAKAPTNRRGKKVYGITTVGRERFHELLVDGTNDDERSFGVRVAFCRHLEPGERLALFERRKAALLSQLHARRGRRGDTDIGRGDPYRRALRERDTRTLANDLAWIDELIATTDAIVAPDEPTGPTAVAPPTAHVVLAPPQTPPAPGSGADRTKAGSQP